MMDLPNADEDYAALSDRMAKLKTQYPVIDKVNEDSGEIRMTAEEHRAYMDYLNLARQMEDMEREVVGKWGRMRYTKNKVWRRPLLNIALTWSKMPLLPWITDAAAYFK